MKTLLAILLAAILSGCAARVEIIPPWFGPIQNHTLECIDGAAGECSAGEWGSEGRL